MSGSVVEEFVAAACFEDEVPGAGDRAREP
jgi:hypothetical protein